MTDLNTAPKAVKVNGKDAHLAACAAAKVEGDARRAKLKAERAAAHQALLDGRKDEAAKRRTDRVANHMLRNDDAKKAAIAAKPANDQVVAADVAA